MLKLTTFQPSPLLPFPCGITIRAVVANTASATWLANVQSKSANVRIPIFLECAMRRQTETPSCIIKLAGLNKTS